MRSSRRIELMLKILIGLGAANLALLGSVLWVVSSGAPPPTSSVPAQTATQPAAAAATTAAPTRSTPAAGRPAGPSGNRVGSPTGASASPPETLRELLEVTVQPMVRAGADRGIDVSENVPSEAEIAAIEAEGTLAGEAGAVVLERLKAGYKALGMPFPDIPMEPQGAPSDPVEADEGPRQVVDSKAVQTWLELTVAQAQEAASAAGAELALPTEAARAAAVASGSFDSEATREVIGPLREAYEKLGLDFPEPGGAPRPSARTAPGTTAAPPTGGGAGAGSPPAAAASGSAGAATQQQKILRAFFTVRNQELEREAAAQGRAAAEVLPAADVVDAAVQSGDIRSAASRAALDAYAAAYGDLGLKWRDPVGG